MSLEPAEETLAEFVPGYPDPVQLLPPGWHGAGGATADGGTILRIPERETIDIVPPGEVEERRGDHVHATDGGIGHLRGLRIDPGSRRVTHLLVRDGHVWGHQDVDIPAEMVAGFGDGIRLSVTRQQVRDLPPAGPITPPDSTVPGLAPWQSHVCPALLPREGMASLRLGRSRMLELARSATDRLGAQRGVIVGDAGGVDLGDMRF